MIKKNPKYSKRINYDALKDLFVTPPSFSQSLNTITDDKGGDNLYIMGMADKSDDDGEGTPLVIIREDIGVVASSKPKSGTKQANMRLLTDDPEVASDDNKYDDEKYDGDAGWEAEDMYEQEI